VHLAHGLHAFGRRDQADQAQLARAVGLEARQRGTARRRWRASGPTGRRRPRPCGAAGARSSPSARACPRRVAYPGARRERLRQPQAVDHPQTGAQDEDDRDLRLQRRLPAARAGCRSCAPPSGGRAWTRRPGSPRPRSAPGGRRRAGRVAQDRQAVVEDGVLDDGQALGHAGANYIC
jgi:hypothetical protein